MTCWYTISEFFCRVALNLEIACGKELYPRDKTFRRPGSLSCELDGFDHGVEGVGSCEGVFCFVRVEGCVGCTGALGVRSERVFQMSFFFSSPAGLISGSIGYNDSSVSSTISSTWLSSPT